MTGWLRVAAWWVALLLLGWAVAASLVDRLAGQGVLLRAPAALSGGGGTLTARAWVAYRAGDLATAGRLARAALRRRPVDAATLRTAGLIALAGGEAARGDRLMRLAGTAGWRDVPTQLFWAQAAVDGGAFDVAAERLEAVQRATPNGAENLPARALLRRLEAIPAGRAALLHRWRAPNEWAAPYLADARDLDRAGLEMRAATAIVARPIVERYTDVGQGVAWALFARAPDLAFRVAATDQRRLLFTPEIPGPFDWNVSMAAGLDAEVRGPGALHVAAGGPGLSWLAYRRLRLARGAWRLAMGVEGAKTAAPLLATLECVTAERTLSTAIAEPLDVGRGRAAFLLRVPDGCPMQKLTLAVTGEESGRGADLLVSAPTLSRATDGP